MKKKIVQENNNGNNIKVEKLLMGYSESLVGCHIGDTPLMYVVIIINLN